MHTATLTFETMERRADRTRGMVLFAKHVRHQVVGAVLFAALNIALKRLLAPVSKAEFLNSLSREQVEKLTSHLQEMHHDLNSMLNHPVMYALKRKLLFGRMISELEEKTEDLYDVIENLTLSENPEFRMVIADCVEKLSIGRTPEPVGRM